jgi:hypothetical protein
MKKLIYFTLGNNPEYIKLAKLCIDSINRFNYDGDLLFITNFKNLIQENINFKNDVFFLDLGGSNLMNSSANKLKIYNFNMISNYDKIIFCDLDILFTKSPDVIFDEIKDDKFYVSNENDLMCEEWWGGRILTNDEKKNIKDLNILGINAGFFAFNKSMIRHLYEIDVFLSKNIHLSNECLEQPFLNVYLYRNSLYNNILTNHVSHNGYNLSEFNGSVLHFAGGPGSFGIKWDRMNNFFKKNINDNISN